MSLITVSYIIQSRISIILSCLRFEIGLLPSTIFDDFAASSNQMETRKRIVGNISHILFQSGLQSFTGP